MWNPTNKLLFINNTDNSSLYKEIADKVIKNPCLINKMEVFKALYTFSSGNSVCYNPPTTFQLSSDIGF